MPNDKPMTTESGEKPCTCSSEPSSSTLAGRRKWSCPDCGRFWFGKREAMGGYDHMRADILDEVGLRGRSEQNIECLINAAFREDGESYREAMTRWAKENGIEARFGHDLVTFFHRGITSPYSNLREAQVR